MLCRRGHFYSAAIGAKLGSWSSSYPDVYALDFGPVTTPGTYTISVSGPITGSSPSFPIGTAAKVYAGALSNARSFYQNERDGANYIPSPLRTAPGHLNDAHAMTSLIVGDGSTFPDCMQHQVTNLVGSLDGSPPVLAGAAVEGPNSFAATGVVDGMKTCPVA